MYSKKYPSNSVVTMVGSIAIAVGIFLAIAFVQVRPDGSTVILVPGAGTVGALALLFMVAGAGVCCRVALAAEVLTAGFATLGCCQVMAAGEALGWVAGLEHTLFAQWLCGGAFVLWRHRRRASL